MKPFSKLNCLGLAFAGILATSCTEQPTAVADYQIVPMPLENSSTKRLPAEERRNDLLHGR